MRLLHTKYFRWIETFEDVVPPYAILSHRWPKPSEEVTFQDLQCMEAPENEAVMRYVTLSNLELVFTACFQEHIFHPNVGEKALAGFRKLEGACDMALTTSGLIPATLTKPAV
jgi:hypothetical protein